MCRQVTCGIPQSSIKVLQNCLKLNTTGLFADDSRMTATDEPQSKKQTRQQA